MEMIKEGEVKREIWRERVVLACRYFRRSAQGNNKSPVNIFSEDKARKNSTYQDPKVERRCSTGAPLVGCFC